MGSIQIHNAERDALQIPDRQAYEHYHEPLGDFGVYNGQFEQGLAGRYANDLTMGVEGWELIPAAGGTVDRVNGGLAGNWRMRGGQVGTGQGGDIIGWKYIPVDEDRDYYISAAFIASVGTALVRLGAICYNAAKASLGFVSAVPGVAPGTSWVRYQRNIGPNGDAAWPAGTRYCRIRIFLQELGSLTNEWAYVDDVQFGQLKKTYSPLIRFVQGIATDTTTRDFTAQAHTLYPNSGITLTLEEPGYIWIAYNVHYTKNITAIRTLSHVIAVFIDGVLIPVPWLGGQIESSQINACTMFAVTGVSAAQTAGIHTVDLRLLVASAGDTIRCRYLTGYAYYTRQN